MMRRWPKYVVAAVLLLALLLTLGFTTTPDGRTGAKALAVISEVLPGIPIRPLSWFGKGVVEEKAQVPFGDGPMPADIYRPRVEGRHGAVLVALGVTADFENATLVRFSRAMARTGAVIMIPRSEDLASGALRVAEVERLVVSLQYLRQQPYVDPERVGVFGICVGASLATIATADPRIAGDVAFLNLFGPYYDLVDYIGAITSQAMLYQGKKQAWPREEKPWRVLVQTLLEHVEDATDRDTIEQALLGGLPADGSATPAGLSPRGAAVYRLLVNGDPTRASELAAQLTPEQQAFLRALSPRYVLDRVKARVFVMVDRNDKLVPYVHSRLTAAHLPGSRYTEFRLFEHVQPTQALNPLRYTREVSRLLRHVNLVFQQFM